MVLEPDGERRAITLTQEQAITSAIGPENAALREAFCVGLLEGESFSNRDALFALMHSCEMGIFPRWEVLERITSVLRDVLENPDASLDKAFARPVGRKKTDKWVFLDMAAHINDGASAEEAARRVKAQRRIAIEAKNLAESYRNSGGTKWQKEEETLRTGKGSRELRHLQRAMALNRRKKQPE